MERDSVAFTVKDQSPEAVRADLVLRLEHLPAAGEDGRLGSVVPSLHRQINQRPAKGLGDQGFPV